MRAEGKCYLICEEDGEGSVYRDEMPQNYWLLQYKNGGLASTNLYYGDECGEEMEQTPLYDDFAIAAREFFKKYGISLADDVDLIRDVGLGTILSNQNVKVARIF